MENIRHDMAAAARWMGGRFASFASTFWLYIILWGVVAGAFSVLLYIDGIFSRHLAPESINPLSFQAMGWTYRFFAASFLMAAARCAVKGVDGKWTFRLLGVFASLIVCMHAWGFGLEALSERRDDAMAVRQVVEIAQTSNTELIAALDARKAQIDVDTDKAVTALNAEITQYITDGLNNDDLADDSRARRNALQDQAMADKRAIDDQIMSLVTNGAEGRAAAVEIEAEQTAWAPLFVGMAQLFTQSRTPTDWAIYLCGVTFIVLWVLLAEALVIFLPERIYRMHLHDADTARNAAPREKSEPHVRAADTRRRRKRRNDKMIESAGYYEDKLKSALRYAERTTWLPSGIADKVFKTTPAEMEAILENMVERGYATPAQVDLIMRRGENLPAVVDPNRVDVISPLNGADKGDEDNAVTT